MRPFLILSFNFDYFFCFQLPSLLSQMNASGKPVDVPRNVVAPSATFSPPSNVFSAPPLSAGPPQITVIDSDSHEEDADVQSITIPFRSASSGAFLPMISVDDKWFSEQEFRYFKISFYVSHQLNQLAELL